MWFKQGEGRHESHLDYDPADVTFLADEHYQLLRERLAALAPDKEGEIDAALFYLAGGIWPRETAYDVGGGVDLPAEYHMGAALMTIIDLLASSTDNTSLTDAQRREVLALLESANRMIAAHVRRWWAVTNGDRA